MHIIDLRSRSRATCALTLMVGAIITGGPLTAAEAAGTSKGWGPSASFVGRYHVRILTASASASGNEPTSDEGIFGSVLSSAQRLSAASARPTGGELTLFMQEEFSHAPLVPSGILNLRTSAGTELLYLTSLTSSGKTRKAKVNGGAFVGPVLGSFSGTAASAGKLTGKVVAKGIATFTASFTRFSKSAQP